jgi:DNA-binding CsgD family transcriptional regulator
MAAHGALILVEGGPGAGKSAVLDAAVALAESRKVQVLRAAGSEFERDFRYGVVRQLFRSRVARTKRDPLAPLGLDQPSAERPEHAVDQALLDLLSRTATARPVLLAIDDLALADLPSLAFLRFLAMRQADHPVVTLATLNPAHVGAPPPASLLSIERSATVVPLEPLDREGVEEMLRRAGRPADGQACEELIRLTAGNPFLLSHMVGLPHDTRIPAAVTRDVQLRLASLAPAARQLAQAAAVLGHGASVSVAARTMGVRPALALEALDALAHAGVLARSGMVVFSAPLLRSAIYGMLGEGERAGLHRRAALALWLADAPALEAVEHLMACDCEGAGEPWAVEILRSAAREAPDRRTAVSYLRRALSEDPPAPVRAEVLGELAAAELSGDAADAARHLAQVVDLLPPGIERAEASEQLGRVLWGLGSYADASRHFSAGWESLGDHGGSIRGRLSTGCVAAGRVLRDAGGPHVPIPDLAAVQASPDAPATAAVLALELLLAGGNRDRVAALAGGALVDGRLLHDHTAGGPAYQAAVCALVWADELESAERAATAAIQAAASLGMEPALGVMLLLRACARFRSGRLRAALVDARAAALRTSGQLPVPAPSPHALIAEIQIAQGQLAAARESSRRALGSPAGEVEHALALSAGAEVELVAGSAQLALARLTECGSRLLQVEVRSPSLAPWRSRAAIAAMRLGDRESAARLVAEERELADAGGSARARGLALMAGASLRKGDERVAELRAAVSALERAPGMVELARALVELGAELRRRGRRRAAREALRRSLDLSVRCGAERLARLAHQDLLATGARPRRAQISGVGSLTPRERQIAELAALGRSNRAIADELIVSEKTIEWHLANAYRKLEIHSRAGLSRSLAET